jgi:hypothetical protein
MDHSTAAGLLFLFFVFLIYVALTSHSRFHRHSWRRTQNGGYVCRDCGMYRRDL